MAGQLIQRELRVGAEHGVAEGFAPQRLAVRAGRLRQAGGSHPLGRPAAGANREQLADGIGCGPGGQPGLLLSCQFILGRAEAEIH